MFGYNIKIAEETTVGPVKYKVYSFFVLLLFWRWNTRFFHAVLPLHFAALLIVLHVDILIRPVIRRSYTKAELRKPTSAGPVDA
jgi:hypothetical protein